MAASYLLPPKLLGSVSSDCFANSVAAGCYAQGVLNSIMLAKPFAPVQLVTAIAQLRNTPPIAAIH
jgi:hypothetical protein